MTACYMLLTLGAWSQVEYEPAELENPEKEIFLIEKQWTQKTLTVENAFPKAMVRNFAKAFCQQYQGYIPNLALVDYLKKPGNYTLEEKHYQVDDAPRNGFIKADMAWQFDFMTEVCYWRRSNGHSLVGILMQMGHEGERADNALLFYDYNPTTRVMTPDLKVYQTAKNIIARHKGTPIMWLPKEGKNIDVECVQWIGSDDEDFRYDMFQLEWTGNSFKESKK